jgi:hypothetical protein
MKLLPSENESEPERKGQRTMRVLITLFTLGGTQLLITITGSRKQAGRQERRNEKWPQIMRKKAQMERGSRLMTNTWLLFNARKFNVGVSLSLAKMDMRLSLCLNCCTHTHISGRSALTRTLFAKKKFVTVSINGRRKCIIARLVLHRMRLHRPHAVVSSYCLESFIMLLTFIAIDIMSRSLHFLMRCCCCYDTLRYICLHHDALHGSIYFK